MTTLPVKSSPRSQERSEATDRQIRRLMVVLLLVGTAIILRPIWGVSATDRLLLQAARHLMAEQYTEAEHCAIAALEEDPQSSLALLIAGESATRRQRDVDAIRYFRRVKDDGSANAVRALYLAANRLVASGLAREAEDCLRLALRHDSNNTEANQALAVLLQKQGRTWESWPFLRRVLLNGYIEKPNIIVTAAIDTTFLEDYQFIENCLAADPSNSQVLLGRARLDLTMSRFDSAEDLLRRVVREHPESIEAFAQLGSVLLDNGTEAEIVAWRQALPNDAKTHPDIWHTEGILARRSGQNEAAIRCFLEAAVRDPNHAGATFQLSQLLSGTKYSDVAERLGIRSKQLSQLKYLLMEVRYGYDTNLTRKVTELLDALDRPHEAAAWCQMLQQWKLGNADWAKSKKLQLITRLSRDTGDDLTLSSGQPVAHIDRSQFPLPDWSATTVKATSKKCTSPVDGNVRFVNMATEVGIDFNYFNGTTSKVGLVHILQATGGGVAVIDFDLDGWQDLYFVQSGPFPIEPGETFYSNRLYRNLGTGRFEDVTATSGLEDTSFGQGVAVGDYNSDGFPDLYVSNFGSNRLYENSGDGHFVDVTQQSGTGGDHWTTSCMFADLDGDALPEIYAVNYALKDEVLELACKHLGEPRTCAPTLFTAEQDQLYYNRGDGHFENITQQSGVVAEDGKGLAVVAADFEGDGQLNIFVANDTSANFYFQNETSTGSRRLAFREQAIVTGVGFDEVGELQACMGLAAGDANGDGLLDLFVTNFYGESNVLYSQNSDHSFSDSTREANLRDSGLHMLGFGTQFLDGELDGWPDLIIANGHIDLTFSHGNPDRMQPQYLRNTGDGNFVEQTSTSLGSYFEGRYFGRTIATLDWNRDGRGDACVSHLDAPAALLTNRTTATGNYFALMLRGVECNRDAIGAIVTVEAGGRQWVQHVVGGSGYFASNQRQLLFGLADSESIDRLTIRWPPGNEQVFNSLPVNQEVIAVENGNLFKLQR
ncbi:MAG: VCBS repeat-containing protein [Planctomycetales bacterium]|nr:VCBS repeat-containing protein [Planctomycetales bacterium]